MWKHIILIKRWINKSYNNNEDFFPFFKKRLIKEKWSKIQRQLYQHLTRYHRLNPSNRRVETWKPKHGESVSSWISFAKAICRYNEINSYYKKLEVKIGIPIFLQVKMRISYITTVLWKFQAQRPLLQQCTHHLQANHCLPRLSNRLKQILANPNPHLIPDSQCETHLYFKTTSYNWSIS